MVLIINIIIIKEVICQEKVVGTYRANLLRMDAWKCCILGCLGPSAVEVESKQVKHSPACAVPHR